MIGHKIDVLAIRGQQLIPVICMDDHCLAIFQNSAQKGAFDLKRRRSVTNRLHSAGYLQLIDQLPDQDPISKIVDLFTHEPVCNGLIGSASAVVLFFYYIIQLGYPGGKLAGFQQFQFY